jgi:hypothetical protein
MDIVVGLILSILAIGSLVVDPVRAQTFDPNYPVCIHFYGEVAGERMACAFKSLTQCAAAASGLPATCLINPYFKSYPVNSSTDRSRKKSTAERPARREDSFHPR